MILVTGAGGFVGSVIARMLRARGDEVRSVARGDYQKSRTYQGEETVESNDPRVPLPPICCRHPRDRQPEEQREF